ncbi:MAG: NAD-dependent epimerase/dehydratase family protein [Pseudomonadota bacterium]
MRIAIIGATGMLGHHAAIAATRAGHELIVVYRNPLSLPLLHDLQFDARQADLNDRAALKSALAGADAVINCAGYYPTVPRPWKDEVTTALVQMQNFYDACAGLPLHKIVYLGGAIALPRHPAGLPGNEQLEYPGPPRDKNPYLQVKWAMDAQARAEARKGLPVTIGIPTMSFGEFDPGNTTGRFITELAKRTLPGYVNGQRNVIYAGDAGRGLVRVCEDGRPGERYLLAGENMTMQALMAKIAAVTGAPLPKQIPLGVARLVSQWQNFRYLRLGGPEPKVSESAIAVMSSGQFVDGSKALLELGFKAEVPVDEAIRRTLAWFRSRGLVRT